MGDIARCQANITAGRIFITADDRLCAVLKPVQLFSVNSRRKLSSKSLQFFPIPVPDYRQQDRMLAAIEREACDLSHKQKGRAEARPFRSDNNSEAISALRELE
jgi:hypothetical protein